MSEVKMSKQSKLIQALESGQSFTAAQITKKFGIKNPSATVSDIRYSGIPVYTEQRTLNNGILKTYYKSGPATRELIAAGYRALSMKI